MKTGDYMRLAKISLASRKKNTKSTVRGIAVGLIFLIPVIYIALGVYMGLSGQLNNAPELLSIGLGQGVYNSRGSITAEQIDQTQENNYWSEPCITSAELDKAAAVTSSDTYFFEQVSSAMSYTNLTGTDTSGMAVFAYSVDGGEQKPIYYKQEDNYGRNYSTKFSAILETEKSSGIKDGKFAPYKMADRYGGSMFVGGMDGNFTGDGKGQVIVSEYFLDLIGINAQSVYGKTLSLSYQEGRSVGYGNIRLDDDSNPNNNYTYDGRENSYDIDYVTDYKVVGVIKSAVTTDAMSVGDRAGLLGLMQNLMFFTSASRDCNGVAVEPVVTMCEEENGDYTDVYPVATFTDDYMAKAGEYIGMGAIMLTSLTVCESYSGGDQAGYAAPNASLVIDSRDYAALDTDVQKASIALSAYMTAETFTSFATSSMYQNMNMLYNVFMIVILVLSIFGGIVFFAAIVNLFNSIAHSVDTRKHYLGVMRAIGARGGSISKLYLFETIRIFLRAAIWVIIFSVVICVGIMIGVNFGFKYLNDALASTGIALGLSWIYIPISILVALAVLVGIGFLFSYSLSRSVSKKPITTILVD